MQNPPWNDSRVQLASAPNIGFTSPVYSNTLRFDFTTKLICDERFTDESAHLPRGDISEWRDRSSTCIRTGESITWQNNGQEPHNVIDAGGAWESPALGNGQIYMFTFNIPGTYTYFCSIHSSMLGTITVADPPAPAQTNVYIPIIWR
jgi:hypothetical protein